VSDLVVEQAQLYARARRGDERALERLLMVARPDLERYARRNCESDDVEEAIQDALWILYRKLGGLRSVAAFSGWLFQVVRRACLALARRRRHASLDEAPEALLVDRSATNAELRLVLSHIIAGLPAAYREALLLKDVQGLSAEEIADLLQISIEATKSRVHRGRAMVRVALADTPSASQPAGVR
jgi:RNA polymerase sigma factor (sigma-70 family)